MNYELFDVELKEDGSGNVLFQYGAIRFVVYVLPDCKRTELPKRMFIEPEDFKEVSRRAKIAVAAEKNK